MGNICHSVLPHSSSYDPNNNDRPTPHPYYAVPVTQPPEFPLQNHQITSLHNNQPLTPPQSYDPDSCTPLQPFYLIKHYDLYYCGQWKKGMPHGQGQIITKDNQYFKGYFSQGVAQGPECLFVISPHTHYLGSVERNQRCGKGIFIDGDYEYYGNWANNLPHGSGKEIFPNGDTYSGEYLAGVKEGEGSYTWKEGPFEYYQGTFKNNEMSGGGTLKLKSGIVWEGTFLCHYNLIIQNSKCLTNDKVFKGDISDGKPINKFTIIDSEKTYELKMQNNKMSGKINQDQNQIVFQDKILRYFNPKISSQTLSMLIDVVEQCYSKAKKHSEALTRIQQKLPDYKISMWRESDPVEGVAIIPICGKYVKVKERRSSI